MVGLFLTNFFNETNAWFITELRNECFTDSFESQTVIFLYDEKQMFPFNINKYGFKQLDRVVEICADYDIYTAFELYALLGGQNMS